jgi:hypothetical protein
MVSLTNGVSTPTQFHATQGGAFSLRGKLYITADNPGSGEAKVYGMTVEPDRAVESLELSIPIDHTTVDGGWEEMEGISVVPGYTYRYGQSDIQIVVLGYSVNLPLIPSLNPSDYVSSSSVTVKHIKVADDFAL